MQVGQQGAWLILEEAVLELLQHQVGAVGRYRGWAPTMLGQAVPGTRERRKERYLRTQCPCLMAVAAAAAAAAPGGRISSPLPPKSIPNCTYPAEVLQAACIRPPIHLGLVVAAFRVRCAERMVQPPPESWLRPPSRPYLQLSPKLCHHSVSPPPNPQSHIGYASVSTEVLQSKKRAYALFGELAEQEGRRASQEEVGWGAGRGSYGGWGVSGAEVRF